MKTDEIKRVNSLLETYIKIHLDKDFSVLSKTADPFLICNRGGTIAYVSDLFVTLLDYSRFELLNMRLSDLFISADINQTKTFFFEKDLEKLHNFDAQVYKKHGSFMDVNVTSFPIFFEKEVVGTYVVLRDISFIKKEKQRISEKQAAAGQLAAGIAHEIRNPITAIKGFLQLIMAEHNSHTMYFKIIESEINRIEFILKELMVLAKPNHVKQKKLNIRLLLEQVLTLMESQMLLHNIEVEKRYSFKEETVLGDENQLKQVFINYIKNAIEAMPSGGKLQIEARNPDENHVQVRIIDEGHGIPPEIINQISQPFFTTKEQGTGLGMAVSNQILREHKGEVDITSNSDGTCIKVNLPTVSKSLLEDKNHGKIGIV